MRTFHFAIGVLVLALGLSGCTIIFLSDKWFLEHGYDPSRLVLTRIPGPKFIQLLDVHPLNCVKNAVNPNLVDVSARFQTPSNAPLAVDAFDVVVGLDPLIPGDQLVMPSDRGTMTTTDAAGNQVAQNFPQDLTGADPTSLEPGSYVDVLVMPSLQPPSFPVKINAWVSAKIGTTIVGRRREGCTVQ